MAKFLFMANYTVDGFKGVLKDGGSGRAAAVGKLAESVGGRLESFYFGFGEKDTYVVCDLPDQQAAAAVALAVGAGGGGPAQVVSLLTPEEIDAVARRKFEYRPPGA